MWSTIPLKDSHLFKIAKLKKKIKQKVITGSAILNKCELFSGIVDKWRGLPKDYIISPQLGENCWRDYNSVPYDRSKNEPVRRDVEYHKKLECVFLIINKFWDGVMQFMV